MSDKYLKRTTVFFAKGDMFDKELFEMLRAITPERNFATKLKELASENLKLTQPKLYEQVVEKLSSDKQRDDISDNSKNDTKVNNTVKSNLRKFI